MAEAFNPLESSRILQDAGCEPKLAEAMASQINGAVSGDVAIKSDIEQLRKDTKSEFELVRKDIGTLATREELKDLTIEIQKMMNTQLRWIIATFLAAFLGAVGLLFTLIKLFGGGVG